MGTGALSLVIKLQEREADHSSPSNAEVMNGGAVPPLPHTSLLLSAELIKLKDNFTCLPSYFVKYDSVFNYSLNVSFYSLTLSECSYLSTCASP
jgi:hypothetical protein